MDLRPSPMERLARARADLAAGLAVVLTGEHGAALVMAAEGARGDRLPAFRGGWIAVTAHRAATLKARAYDGDLARLALPGDATAGWVRAVADPADDLAMPMKGPFRSLRDGDATLSRAGIRLAKQARLLPAVLVAPADPGLAAAQDLTAIPAADVLADAPLRLVPVAAARVPMALARAGRLHVFRTMDGAEEHYAVEIGQPDRAAPVLARLHSACFTGDVLGSLKCDCGPQLHGALAQMDAAGAGVLLYLNQEGRGIGLANKMRAYALQDQGFDTVEANHRLGFEDDERDFRTGAAILRALGFSAVRLMTNNPAKVARMADSGIRVAERVPLRVGENPLNEAYLATKAAKSGHLL